MALLAIGVTVFGVLVVMQVAEAFSGDPGGRILSQLQPATAALPSDARIIYRNDLEPHWDSCDGRPGTFGWNDVVVQVHFLSRQEPAKLLADANDVLTRDRWQPAVLVGPSLPVGAWSKSLANGSKAYLQIARDQYGQNEWTLFAGAPPVGQRASGC